MQDGTAVMPLIFRQYVLPELADRAYIDMQGSQYYPGLFRLVAEIHGVPLDSVSACMAYILASGGTNQVISVIRSLQNCGISLRVIVNAEDYEYLTSLPTSTLFGADNAVIPDPAKLPDLDELSPTLQAMINRLPEVWRTEVGNLIEMTAT